MERRTAVKTNAVKSIAALGRAVAGIALSLTAASHAATYTFSNPAGGDLNVSTNWTPSGIPGSADVATIDDLPQIGTGLTLYVAANQTIGSIAYAHYGQTILDAKLNVGVPYALTLSGGQLNFSDAITESPGIPLTSLFLRAPIAGGSGLTKTGPGFVELSGNNVFTGGLTITGNGTGAVGGVSVSSDANLGAAGGGVTLSNNAVLRTTGAFTSSRAFTVNSTSYLESFNDLVLTGDFGGAFAPIVGRFTSGSVQFGGTLNNGLGVASGATAYLTGRSLGAIRFGGSLTLGRGTVGPNSDALGDTAPITSYGGALNILAGASTRSDTTGTLTLSSGQSTIDVGVSVSAGNQTTFAGMSRQSRATMFVRGREMGAGALAANRSILAFTNTTGLPIVGGGGTTATNDSIAPFILGNANVTGGYSQASVIDAGFVTVGANGLQPLVSADYATTLATASSNNVRLSDGVFTQNSAVTVNSLIIRDTLASSGNSGVGGTGQITLASGALAAVSDLSGEELFVDNPINFGAAEGVVHTAPTSDGHSQLTLRGVLSGSNGLTKAGLGDLFLENTASTYTGTTTINGGIVYVTGNVPSGAASALGNSTTDVVISAGANGGTYTGIRAVTPLSTFARNITVTDGGNYSSNFAVLGTFGAYGTAFNGNIATNSSLNLLADNDAASVMTINGIVSGRGGLQELDVALPQQQIVRLTGNNTYQGETVIRAGRWQLGSNTALGTGTVFFEGNKTAGTQTGTLEAFGGARTLANTLVFRATPVLGGSNALTFTGSVDLGSVQRDVIVANSADTTFNGVVGRGGITKRGSGRLILAGANTYTGQTIIAEGALRAANNAALGVSTLSAGQATFIVGTGSLELAGPISSAEAIYFGATLDGVPAPITSALPTGNLRSVVGNNTLSGDINFDDVGTLGVDAGSTLTLTGNTLDNTPLDTAVLRKVGAGTLVAKNVRLSGLAVDAGTVRIASDGTQTGTSRVSSLTLASATTLDLTNNSLVYDYTTTSPLASVQAALLAGKITTSIATAGAAIGYGEASALYATFPQSFGGQVVDSTTVLVTQTLRGDANLDRTVNFDDLLALAQNYSGAGKVWTTGDFDYNGAVNFDDLLALAQNYGASTLSGGTVFAGAVDFASDWALAQSLVPEPASLSLIALAVLPRRRR